jgi:hypothetical protein
MKIKMLVVFFAGLLLAGYGCGEVGNQITGGATLEITRSVPFNDSFLYVVAQNVTLQYDQRRIIVSGLNNIAGDYFSRGLLTAKGGNFIVNEIKIDQQGNMIIVIPPDADYDVWINGQHHMLSRIVEKTD